MSADTIDADGNKSQEEIAYEFDGKDYPLIGPQSPTAFLQRESVDVRLKVFGRNKGRWLSRRRLSFHLNGKTLTVMRIGRDSQGDFIRTLTPAQQTYLRTLDMSNAIKQHERPESTEKIEFLLGGGQK